MTKIIGISGKIKTGKDELANYLRNAIISAGNPCMTMGFGDHVKKVAATILGIDVSNFYSHEFKESLMSSNWNRRRYKDGKIIPESVVIDYGNMPECQPFAMTYREFLQDLGTSLRKYLHENIWCNWLANYNTAGVLIIPDVRFPNEANLIRSLGGKVYRLERHIDLRQVSMYSNDILDHDSEIALDNYDGFECVYHNNGTLQDLYSWASQIL